ncbi:baseplate wedge tail fiber connector [Kosakonia phage Kc304]|uniref:Baseplate wedge tail fiber connector n=2 Tax=Winklervirus chi14 TaxID=2560752 RepID=A0A1Z1LYH1_9CAUD|nr:baseplate wedge tail fiber protein connector [Serratia phage CHI14]ARW57859.1 baseplate wedge tail fiber connector [Serratia phage CBH8]QYN80607.1 baseplate wedge tail fiber connector [Kosakonia phage Kc304]UJJ22153.1 baseplate wedge tail fiber connector [Erwinia phage Virsaitis27]UYM28815.1 baseplate wedge tail fiber connector [Serratia phage vB_SspM_LC53]ARW57584.1 baseplate wedge tail fiber connector [Serratia phage CHI14]
MLVQNTKTVIDTGEIGNASTGDIIFDGGNKINSNFNSIYNAFGDQRLFSTNEGEERQTIHATGYYQKVTEQSQFGAEVPMGSLVDVDSNSGPMLARLPRGKMGEGMVFINSNGSFNQTNPLIIQPTGSFVNVGGDGTLRVTDPYTRVLVWCISDTDGIYRWDHSIENLFGHKVTPIDKTYSLNSTVQEIRIAFRDEFNTVKLLLTAASTDDSKVKVSETMISADWKNKKVYSTEYAVIRRGNVSEEDEIYDIEFKYDSEDYLIAAVKSDTSNLRFAIKAIATQKFGVGSR